jgi:hypothetical protein
MIKKIKDKYGIEIMSGTTPIKPVFTEETARGKVKAAQNGLQRPIH